MLPYFPWISHANLQRDRWFSSKPCLIEGYWQYVLGSQQPVGPSPGAHRLTHQHWPAPRRSWRPNQGFTLWLFPTCQVRVVRFYVSCLLPSAFRLPLPLPAASCLVLLLFVILVVLVVLVVLVQLRSAIHIVLCRTSTTTIHAQCSLPDLNHDQPRPVFPAGPQPRPCPPSVPCRTSTASIHAKCSLPDLMQEDKMSDRVPEDLPGRMPENMPEDMPDRYARRYSRRYAR